MDSEGDVGDVLRSRARHRRGFHRRCFDSREILILRRLDHPNVIKLEGLLTSRMSCSLYLVFEYMEHDLAGLASFPGVKFTEPQVKCYMQQLLRGLEHCHSCDIMHRDIKGSNLLIDNRGVLKIADFGLASFFDPEQRHRLLDLEGCFLQQNRMLAILQVCQDIPRAKSLMQNAERRKLEDRGVSL